jgi:hypothetical protein
MVKFFSEDRIRVLMGHILEGGKCPSVECEEWGGVGVSKIV